MNPKLSACQRGHKNSLRATGKPNGATFTDEVTRSFYHRRWPTAGHSADSGPTPAQAMKCRILQQDGCLNSCPLTVDVPDRPSGLPSTSLADGKLSSCFPTSALFCDRFLPCRHHQPSSAVRPVRPGGSSPHRAHPRSHPPTPPELGPPEPPAASWPTSATAPHRSGSSPVTATPSTRRLTPGQRNHWSVTCTEFWRPTGVCAPGSCRGVGGSAVGGLRRGRLGS